MRGVCSLRPGVPGVSENIRVRSIIGRFFEHSRMYYFHNGGEEKVYIGSADLMPRNLNRRVEVLFPIESSRIVRRIRDKILDKYLADQAAVRHNAARWQIYQAGPPSGQEGCSMRKSGL